VFGAGVNNYGVMVAKKIASYVDLPALGSKLIHIPIRHESPMSYESRSKSRKITNGFTLSPTSLLWFISIDDIILFPSQNTCIDPKLPECR
jgi:hypothetical protein